jgi:hypothetical protein
MAGTASAPAIAQAPEWDSPQLVTDFEKASPAKDVEKLEYMNLRAPADIGSTTYFLAMEGTMAATKQGDLAVRSKIMTPGPCEETTWRILYSVAHSVALHRDPPEVPYSPWAGMRLLDILPYLPVSVDYKTLVHLIEENFYQKHKVSGKSLQGVPVLPSSRSPKLRGLRQRFQPFPSPRVLCSRHATRKARCPGRKRQLPHT